MPRNDRELTRACLDGDPRAWDEFVERYGRLIYSIPRRLGLCEMDSEDVLQTVLSIALRRLETLRDVERLSAWLIRTTYRESWRYAKRTRKHAELDENVADDQAPSPEQCEVWERQHLVHQALARLDERCSRLLKAVFFETNTNYEQIAEELGLRVGSIGPTRARCLKKLEGLLTDLGL